MADACPNLIAALAKKVTTPEEAVCEFYTTYPHFCDTLENWNTLTAYLPEEFDHELRWPTAVELKTAYELARKDGHFRIH